MISKLALLYMGPEDEFTFCIDVSEDGKKHNLIVIFSEKADQIDFINALEFLVIQVKTNEKTVFLEPENELIN